MFCLLVQHLLLAILSTWLPQFVLVNAKFNVLVVSPASRLHATHLAWHKNLANIFLRDDRVESVLLLGLVNSLEEEKEKDKRDTIEHGGKLTVWRRNRCGRVKPNCEKEVDKYHSANPIPNPWRKRVEFKMDVSKANTHYLDILMYNDELVNELRAKKFNMGCIEGIGLDGFQQGLLHILGIPNTCMTSSVLPFMPHWQMLGLDEIVKRIPGLDLAKIGNHEEVKRNEENNLKDTEIEKRNRQLIKDHAIISDNTHKLWKEKLTEKYAGQSELLHLVQTLPKMEEMFKQTPVYFVHYQVMMDYPFVEEEYNRHISKLKPKLRYIGGIGMTDAETGEVDNKVVDSKTIRKDIGIGKEPIVLVSFGSVIDMGVRNEEDLEETTDADAEEALFIEDCVAKEEAMLDVFEGFNGQEEGKAHTQFIWKYGNYPKEGPYQKVKENVHGKSWLPQPQILGLGPSEVRAFISHCGLNSVVEAVKAGIPLICIPLFGDQLNNSEGLASREVAIVIDIQTYDDQHKREATHHHHQGETAHQQHQGHKATAGKLNEGDIRKAADAIFSEALIKALKELSVPGNKWATNMAKMRDSFNQLKPTETILKELAALPVPKAHNPKEQSHPNPKHVPIMHSPSRSGHEHDQR